MKVLLTLLVATYAHVAVGLITVNANFWGGLGYGGRGYGGRGCKGVTLSAGQTAFIGNSGNRCVSVVCPNIEDNVLGVDCVFSYACDVFGRPRTCYGRKTVSTEKGAVSLNSTPNYLCLVRCNSKADDEPATSEEPLTTQAQPDIVTDFPTTVEGPGADTTPPVVVTTPPVVVTTPPVVVTTPPVVVTTPEPTIDITTAEPTDEPEPETTTSDSETEVQTEPIETTTEWSG